jgi:hypothetical protein
MASAPTSVELATDQGLLRFAHVELVFLDHGLTNVFGMKNNKTLGETLEHQRYRTLSAAVMRDYRESLGMPLGAFLVGLKSRSDHFYKRFLNPHGDERYCHFSMAECAEERQKGLYLYALEGDVVYIGRSYDPFGKRVDQGYRQDPPEKLLHRRPVDELPSQLVD